MASNSSEIDHGNYVPVPVTEGIHVPDGGSYRKVFLNELPEKGFVVGKDASLDITVVMLPGHSAELPLTVDLMGEGSEVRLAGICLCKDDDQVTIDITMNHRSGHCKSQQIFNTLAAGASKSAFFGKIVVAPEAQKTEAYQENHNIVLTVGKLNEDEQFYMRSRGIPEEEAKVLQMISFVAPILTHVGDEDLDAAVEAAIRELA